MNVDLPEQEALSLGSTLRSLREAQQLDLAQVSVHIKFSVRQLQALEADDWVHLPVGLALRGMVKNYARFLQTDAAALLNLLEAQTQTGTVPSAQRLPPISLGDGVPLYDRDRNKPWLWMLVILLVVLVMLVYAGERGWLLDVWRIFD